MENVNQKALRLWITKGLSIPEIKDLKGNSNYLLNNMIAKYTLYKDEYMISELALKELNNKNVDLSKVYNRSFFYGKKKPFLYEHAIPATVIRNELIKSDGSLDSIRKILEESGDVAVILRTEDEKLKNIGLNSKMPNSWKLGDDSMVRYRKAKILLSNKKLKVKGAIVR
tara:strand:+ start:91 stop:600 length:510 start_codon:yes stop_codon:yes gene_type:complete